MSKVRKNATLQAIIDAAITELMIKTTGEQIYLDDNTTLSSKMAEMVAAINLRAKKTDVESSLTSLESDVNAKIDTLESSVNTKLDTKANKTDVNSSLSNLESSVNTKLDTKANKTDVESSLTSLESDVNTKISTLQSSVETKISDVNKAVNLRPTQTAVTEQIAALKQELMGDLPVEAYDTFTELAAYIESHEEAADALTAAIGTKADKSVVDDILAVVNGLGAIAKKDKVSKSDLDTALQTELNAKANKTDATKVTDSSTNGNVVVDGQEVEVYKHPSYTAKSNGLYKVTVDSTGHISAVTAVSKADITALGIPSGDTNTHYASKNVVSNSPTATSNTTSALSNGSVYLISVENGVVTSSHKISGSGNATVTTDANGNIVINSVHPTIATSADTTSTASPKHGGTVTMVDSVTRDSNGHVTKVNTKTVTLPSDNNTDTKVTQTATTSNANYPLLLAPSGQTATSTTTAYFDSDVTLNPSTNTIAANVSGNAATATKLNSSAGSATKPVYFSDGKPVACSHTLEADVPSGAKFTDTTYSNATASAAGLMSAADKVKLDGISEGAGDASDKMDSTNPVGTGSFSLNRKANTTVGNYSFTEGYNSTASGYCSHAEGYNSTASGYHSHAEGYNTTASNSNAHAEGGSTTASGLNSHAEGVKTTASGLYSHAAGAFTEAKYAAQCVVGYGNDPQSDSIFEIGNGLTAEGVPASNGDEPSTRQNAFRVNQSGQAIAQTGLGIGSTVIDESGLKSLGRKFYTTTFEARNITVEDGYNTISFGADSRIRVFENGIMDLYLDLLHIMSGTVSRNKVGTITIPADIIQKCLTNAGYSDATGLYALNSPIITIHAGAVYKYDLYFTYTYKDISGLINFADGLTLTMTVYLDYDNTFLTEPKLKAGTTYYPSRSLDYDRLTFAIV